MTTPVFGHFPVILPRLRPCDMSRRVCSHLLASRGRWRFLQRTAGPPIPFRLELCWYVDWPPMSALIRRVWGPIWGPLQIHIARYWLKSGLCCAHCEPVTATIRAPPRLARSPAQCSITIAPPREALGKVTRLTRLTLYKGNCHLASIRHLARHQREASVSSGIAFVSEREPGARHRGLTCASAVMSGTISRRGDVGKALALVAIAAAQSRFSLMAIKLHPPLAVHP